MAKFKVGDRIIWKHNPKFRAVIERVSASGMCGIRFTHFDTEKTRRNYEDSGSDILDHTLDNFILDTSPGPTECTPQDAAYYNAITGDTQ